MLGYLFVHSPFLWRYLKEIPVKGSGLEYILILLPGNRTELHRVRAFLFLHLVDMHQMLGGRVPSPLEHFVVAKRTRYVTCFSNTTTADGA